MTADEREDLVLRISQLIGSAEALDEVRCVLDAYEAQGFKFGANHADWLAATCKERLFPSAAAH